MKTDTTTMIAMTQREIFLMEKAYKAGAWYPGGLFAWLASPVAGSVTVGESLISDAPLDTAVSDFLARTGQYVTNDASRDAAIAAAVEHDDMAAVGRALMHAIAAHAPKGWAPADCPSEIVGDLRNAIDESYSNGVRAGLGMAASELDDWACEMDSVSPEAASELREHAESLRGKP